MIQLELIETLARLNAHDFRHLRIILADPGPALVGADAVPMNLIRCFRKSTRTT